MTAVDRRELRGPFDVVGDVHGCMDELCALLAKLGWLRGGDGVYRHAAGRTLVFVGDLVDRGPDVPGTLRVAMDMSDAGVALCVQGNHERKLARKLRGADVVISHGLAGSLEQLAREPVALIDRFLAFEAQLPAHLLLDDGKLVVAHAGLPERLHGKTSREAQAVALFGLTTGERDDEGYPVRLPWANDYRGAATVVYGHTPEREARWVNGTICIDTGCVFGGNLTALRWPERELVDVPAARAYFVPTHEPPPAPKPESERDSKPTPRPFRARGKAGG